MKILHIISGGDKGGAKTHMFALLDELCKLADVTVVCLMRGVFYEEILERDVNTVLFEQKSRFDFSVVPKIADLIRDGGYDIAADLDGVLAQFDNIIGLDRLHAIHLNDSKNPCGAHKDRHECIGEGCIGEAALAAVVQHPALRELPFYLETPHDELSGYAAEIELLRKAWNAG